MTVRRSNPGVKRQSTRTAGEVTIDLTALDAALESVSDAESQHEAIASLAKATSLLNVVIGTSSPRPVRSESATRTSIELEEAFGWGKPDAQAWLQEVETRLQKYFKAVETIVEKYHPNQYQITLGFPSGVSVAFTWNVP